MIGQLKGLVEQLDLHHAVIDVQGVGYVVQGSSRTLATLRVGEAARLLIETQVREDAITLYGFATAQEQNLFRTLTTVQGVGARVAMALQSALTPQELVQSIALQNHKTLTRADGVGPKLAQRIVNELKDKIAKETVGMALGKTTGSPTLVVANDTLNDVIGALVGLGYRRADVVPLATQLTAQQPDADVQALLKAALKELAA